jgi:hypothetical protein
VGQAYLWDQIQITPREVVPELLINFLLDFTKVRWKAAPKPAVYQTMPNSFGRKMQYLFWQSFVGVFLGGGNSTINTE